MANGTSALQPLVEAGTNPASSIAMIAPELLCSR